MKAGWDVKKLGEVCNIVNGSTPLRSNKEFWNNGNIEWFTIDDIREQGRKITRTKQKVTEVALKETSLRILPPNSVLLCCTASIGEHAITQIPLATNQQFNGLVVKNKLTLEPFFLFHFCATLKDVLSNLSGKTTIDFIPISRLREIAIPVPPIFEQQRIVAILDQAFEGIAKARANAEQNLKNARALFESHLQSIFTQRGEGWIQDKLVAFTSTVSTGPFGSLLHKSDYVSEGVPLVNPINIVNNSIIPNQSKQINVATKARLQSYILKEGDIVIGRRGEIGRCAVVSEMESGWICGTGCFFIRPLPTTNSQFLANLIRSGNYREKLEQASSGATMLNLSNKALCDLEIAMPNFKEQKTILQRIDALYKETQCLETLYQRKITLLDELKKSLLQQAFAGEL